MPVELDLPEEMQALYTRLKTALGEHEEAVFRPQKSVPHGIVRERIRGDQHSLLLLLAREVIGGAYRPVLPGSV